MSIVNSKTTSRTGLMPKAIRMAKAGLLTLVLMGLGQTALAAATAANTQLENVVTVNYENLAGDAQPIETAFAVITIDLLQATPTVVMTTTGPLDDISEGEDVDLDFQITSNANGPDDYQLDLADTSLTLLDPTTGEGIDSAYDGLTLGATMVGGSATTTLLVATCITPGVATCSIPVPHDDAIDTTVNGIVAGDVVVLDNGGAALYCEVDSVVDTFAVDGNGNRLYVPGTSDSAIVVENCATDLVSGSPGTGSIASYAVDPADGIFETKTYTLTITTGDLTSAAAGQTTISATGETDAIIIGGPYTSGAVTIVINVVPANLEVRKFVRNTTLAVVGDTGTAGDVLTLNSATYYKDGVTARPGDVLEYAIVMINQGGKVQEVIATDPSIPFVVLNAASITLLAERNLDSLDCDSGGGTDTCEVTGGVAAGVAILDTNLADDSNNDFGGVTGGGVITVFAGIGGDEDIPQGGTIDVDKVSIVTYQVTVD